MAGVDIPITVSGSVDLLELLRDHLSQGRYEIRLGPNPCERCVKNAELPNPKRPEIHPHCHCVRVFIDADGNETVA